jgi:hypothetical protein
LLSCMIVERTIWTYTFNKVVDVITELRRKLATPGSRGL